MKKYTPEEIAQTLITFIKSGSADGQEEKRRDMLKMVPLFAHSGDLLSTLIELVEVESRHSTREGTDQARRRSHRQAHDLLATIADQK